MVPMRSEKFYRVVRWGAHLGHLMQKARIVVPGVKPIDVDGLERAMKGLAVGAKPETKEAKAAVAAAAKEKKAARKGGDKAAAPAAAPIAAHPFARVDLRIGKIIKVERHPNADRLFVETVDFGEEAPRTVVSGLVEHVPMEELQDRMGLFVCNLKPATLCKVLSTAMLLVSKDENGLEPLIVPAGAKPGDRVTIEGVEPQPDAVIKPKEDTWESVRVALRMVDGVAHYGSLPLLVAGGQVVSVKAPAGSIS